MGALDRFFGRRRRARPDRDGDAVSPPPVAVRAGMAATRCSLTQDQVWHPGDLAECINADGWFRDGIYPDIGPAYSEIRMVRGVSILPHPLDGRPSLLLVFDRWPGRSYHAASFGKITPRADVAARPACAGVGIDNLENA